MISPYPLIHRTLGQMLFLCLCCTLSLSVSCILSLTFSLSLHTHTLTNNRTTQYSLNLSSLWLSFTVTSITHFISGLRTKTYTRWDIISALLPTTWHVHLSKNMAICHSLFYDFICLAIDQPLKHVGEMGNALKHHYPHSCPCLLSC